MLCCSSVGQRASLSLMLSSQFEMNKVCFSILLKVFSKKSIICSESGVNAPFDSANIARISLTGLYRLSSSHLENLLVSF